MPCRLMGARSLESIYKEFLARFPENRTEHRCFVDEEDGDLGCVLDEEDDFLTCTMARHGMKKEDCEQWKETTVQNVYDAQDLWKWINSMLAARTRRGKKKDPGVEACKKCQWKEPAITLAGAYWRMQKLNKTFLDDDGEVEMEHLSGLAKWAEDKIRALQAVEISSHGKVRLAPKDMQRHECCACLELFTPWPDGDEMNTILCRACALKERL